MGEILYQTGRHYVIAAPKGFEIYRNEGLAAVRCATIGFMGSEGWRRVMAEIERREAAAYRAAVAYLESVA